MAKYFDFERRRFVIKGLFDVNPRLIGISVRGIEIQDIDSMEEYVRNNHIDIAVLTLPKQKAPKTANDLASWGIKGIWNFAPIDLQVQQDNVIVENVHLSESLMTLSYKIKDEL